MTIYLLRNGRNNDIIKACELEANATTLKANLIKTGQYDLINIESLEVDQSSINPLAMVKVRGEIKPQGPVFSIEAYQPSSIMSDVLKFNVLGNVVSFVGYVNLTSAEKALNDVEALTERIKEWVATEFKDRLLNDNPLGI